MKTSIFISLLSLCLFSLSTAAPPVPFSGKLAVDGKNFHGNARFSFSIVDGLGDEHWRHSEEQGSMIENVVLNGRYLVLLGGQGMKALPPRLFLDYDQLFLRVHVDLQDGQGIRLLEPDQRITSSPYALTAELSRIAEKALIADAVSPGAITQDMLADGVFADLNRTITLNDLGLDVVAEFNSTIGRSRLAADVRNDLNRTIVITREMLPPSVREDLNRSIELSDLPVEVLQGLNRTITLNDLGLDVVAEFNSTIDRSRLSADVRNDLNRTIVITREMLPQNVRDDLNKTVTITRSMLPADVLSDLNRTISKSMLGSDVLADLNKSSATASPITLSMLAPEVTAKLDQNGSGGNTTVNNPPAIGSLIALPYGQNAPAGYSLYQRGEPKLVWEEKAPVSVARYAYDGVEVLDGKIYFIGGKSGSSAKNIAERYDPSTNTWETLNSMSVARSGVHSSVLNGKLYAIGGEGLSSVEVFDPNTGNWTAGVSLPVAVSHGSTITGNGKIYLVGGKDSSSQDINQVLSFDPTANQWNTKANMPTARHGMKLVWFKNRIWAIGGQRSSSRTTVESYDVTTDTWQTETSLSEERSFAASWVANGRIYMGGGMNLDSISAYNPLTSNWSAADNLPEKKYLAGAAVLNDKFYILSGHTGEGFSNKVFAADLNASVSGVFDLYRKDGNASSGVPTVQAEVADGSVTTAKIASNTITTSDLNEQILKYLKPEITLAPQAPGLVFNG
ncbi:MAG: kelch repeat-containing protein, partial [Opitutales bacterium]|nr:kelch repeat-containing protein [Opitutales bacterium]